MNRLCARCTCETKPGAKYCGHCGLKIKSEIQRVSVQPVIHRVGQTDIISLDPQLMAQMKLDYFFPLSFSACPL
jgi:hypothetical protein